MCNRNMKPVQTNQQMQPTYATNVANKPKYATNAGRQCRQAGGRAGLGAGEIWHIRVTMISSHASNCDFWPQGN